mmetsp:Transcript_9237/g.28569  ORF Transcript_9237/g.28569 Transcript_9237/m.28569 type:complete len:379 (-) Transcript_9237:79-1215(-)
MGSKPSIHQAAREGDLQKVQSIVFDLTTRPPALAESDRRRRQSPPPQAERNSESVNVASSCSSPDSPPLSASREHTSSSSSSSSSLSLLRSTQPEPKPLAFSVVEDDGIDTLSSSTSTLSKASSTSSFSELDTGCASGSLGVPQHTTVSNGERKALCVDPAVLELVNSYGGELEYTPLHWAARGGFTDVARFLLQCGADPNLRTDYGYTALHFACKKNYSDVVKLLLESGAEVNICDNEGDQPLHLAALEGAFQSIFILLESGADYNALDSHGNTALDLCTLHNDMDTAMVLQRFVGDGQELSPQVNMKDGLSPTGCNQHPKRMTDEDDDELDLPVLEMDSEYTMEDLEEEGIYRSAASALQYSVAEEPLSGRLQQYL